MPATLVGFGALLGGEIGEGLIEPGVGAGSIAIAALSEEEDIDANVGAGVGAVVVAAYMIAALLRQWGCTDVHNTSVNDDPEALAEAARAAGVAALAHVSAIGADANGQAAYARSKGEGEAALRLAVDGGGGRGLPPRRRDRRPRPRRAAGQ